MRRFRDILLLICFTLSSPAIARKSLDISNLPAETKADLIKRFPFVEKDPVKLEQIDDILRFLQMKPHFDSLQVFDEGGTEPYKLRFSQTRLVGDIKVAGIKRISESEARNIFNVKSGDVFDQQDLIEDAEKLRLFYKEKGFFNAVIDIEMPPGKDQTVDILLRVTENKQTIVTSIVLQSPNETLNKKLSSKLSGETDEPLTDELLTAIQKKSRKYLTESRYMRAELTGPNIEYSSDESEATLSYRIERVEKYNVEFSGAKQLSTGTLQDSLDLDSFYSSNPNLAGELSTKIRNLYLSKGYSRVEVQGEETETSDPFQKRLLFTVNEGPRVKIQKIAINGKISRKPKYYTDLIEDLSSPLVAKGYYNKEDLDNGVKNLVLELQNEGYLLSKVISTRTQYNRDRDRVTFHVNLDEGPLTQIEEIQFIGNKSFKSEQLLPVVDLQPDSALKLNQIEQAITDLKNFYHEQGYIEMYLLNEREDLVTYNEGNTRARLNFKIFEGPQVRVSSIALEGNTFTKDYVVLKELEFENGDLVTPAKIEESVARLQRTGYFNSVEIKTLEEKTEVANRTVMVKVSERDPGLFTFGGGATNERTLTLRGYTGVAYRNLWGTGRGVSLRLEGNYNVADVKYLESKVVLGYLEPYLLNTRFRGRVNVTRSSTVTDYDLRKVTDVRSTTYSIEKDFTSHILGVWDIWSLATVKDFGIDSSSPVVTNEIDIATTGPTVDIDFRDNPFNPTKGTFTRLNAEYSDPAIGSTRTIKYIRSTLSFTHYWNVGKFNEAPVVWANQVRGGYLRNLSNEVNGGVPWDKKGFTLGGQSTIRGYKAGSSEAFPNDSDLGGDTYKLTTSSNMYLVKSELRFPVYGAIGGAIFYDGGSVTIEDLDLKNTYRDSTGFGIRYNTPVGPLSLEIAWKLNALPKEDPWIFHLSIGTF